jgi:hypothetical protein
MLYLLICSEILWDKTLDSTSKCAASSGQPLGPSCGQMNFLRQLTYAHLWGVAQTLWCCHVSSLCVKENLKIALQNPPENAHADSPR